MAETPEANPTTGSIISSLPEQQFVLQITSTAHDEPTNKSSASAAYHGTLNFKVTEPIILHINSLTPQSSTSTAQVEPTNKSSAPAQLPSDIIAAAKDPKHQKALGKVGSLANLLPTGTVLAFQAITPSLSYNGSCHVFNKYLVALVMLASLFSRLFLLFLHRQL